MKKVLMIGNSELVIFGFRRELIEALLDTGCEVFVCFPKTEFGNGHDSAEKFGCKYIPCRISSHGTNPLVDMQLCADFCKIIREIQPDIVFTYTIKPNIYGGIAASICKVPYVMNVSGLGTAVEHPGPLQKITLTLYRLATRNAQRVFFQNEENEKFFAGRHIAEGKRGVLPGSGVNLQQFPLLPYPQSHTIHFLYMGRVMKEKGIEQYLDAAEEIHKQYPNTLFHVLGVCAEPRYKARLQALEEAGIIAYHGHQKDLLKFQTISACTIHPSYYPEGMSNVLLESCACGRPIITTDRSGCREILEDGINGYRCKQHDSGDLIAQIQKFLALRPEDRKNMGLAGREKVAREFDRQIVVRKYLEELGGAARWTIKN